MPSKEAYNQYIKYKKIENTDIKIINFGAVREQNDIGCGIILTRVYICPEV